MSGIARGMMVVLLVGVALLGLVVGASAAIVTYGPTPYLSFADSPFEGMGGWKYFYLEDFEDGSLNTAGVTQAGGYNEGPGGASDSVDADDGHIDGSGTNGHDWWGASTITFTFDAPTLQWLPTHVGVVWTDGVRNAHAIVEAWDATGASLGVVEGDPIGGSSNYGQTDEDRFFGFAYTGGISRVAIHNQSGAISIDHLQYGAVPEPSLGLLLLVGIVPLGIIYRRRRRSAVAD